jgi:hypothetical protein
MISPYPPRMSAASDHQIHFFEPVDGTTGSDPTPDGAPDPEGFIIASFTVPLPDPAIPPSKEEDVNFQSGFMLTLMVSFGSIALFREVDN